MYRVKPLRSPQPELLDGTLVFSRQTGFSSGRCVYCDKPNGSQLNLLYQAQAFGRRLEISKRYPSYMQRLAQLLNKDVARL